MIPFLKLNVESCRKMWQGIRSDYFRNMNYDEKLKNHDYQMTVILLWCVTPIVSDTTRIRRLKCAGITPAGLKSIKSLLKKIKQNKSTVRLNISDLEVYPTLPPIPQ